MEGTVLSPKLPGKAAGALARVRAARDRVLFPEATSGTEQWQRVTLNAAVSRHVDALGPRA